MILPLFSFGFFLYDVLFMYVKVIYIHWRIIRLTYKQKHLKWSQKHIKIIFSISNVFVLFYFLFLFIFKHNFAKKLYLLSSVKKGQISMQHLTYLHVMSFKYSEHSKVQKLLMNSWFYTSLALDFGVHNKVYPEKIILDAPKEEVWQEPLFGPWLLFN